MSRENCDKCRKPLALVSKWYRCEKCQAWFCPSCMDRFCMFCRGAVKQVERAG